MLQLSPKALATFDKLKNSGMTEWVGTGDPKTIGSDNAHLLSILVKINRDTVLFDMGCGIGRVSVAVLDLLRPKFLYGFDIVPDMVRFCRETIQPAYDNCAFECVDASNVHYDHFGGTPIVRRPEAELYASIEGKIDVAFAFSVFTHLPPDAAQRYLNLLFASLRTDGQAVISAFLLDRESRSNLVKGRAHLPSRLPLPTDDFFDAGNDLGFVAFEAEYLFQMARKAGFAISALVCGAWRGAIPSLNANPFQDVIVLRKPYELPEDFDAKRYIDLHADVRASGVQAAHHYINFGRHEGRQYK